MQTVSSALLTALRSGYKPFRESFEFYLPTETDLSPQNAVKVYTAVIDESLDNLGNPSFITYECEVISRTQIARHFGREFNEVSINLSNASKAVSEWVLTTDVEGLRMLIRVFLRNVTTTGYDDNQAVAFVGRCAKPDSFDRAQGTIKARQDLGTITAELPTVDYQLACPLKFKGADCLGTEVLADKSAAYQAATTCNKSLGQCQQYENTEFNQLIHIEQVQGSFIHRPHEGFFAKLIGLLTPGSGKRRKVVGSSVHDGTPYGKARALVLGRWQMTGEALIYKDIGTSINFGVAFAQGPIHDFINIQNTSGAFTAPLGITEHYGNYGGEANQAIAALFPSLGFLSRLAYIEGYVNGSDIATEEAAPSIQALIAGIKCRILANPNSSGVGRLQNFGNLFETTPAWSDPGFIYWTDNAVELTRWIITDPAILNNPFVNDEVSGQTAAYCTQAVKDDSGAERVLLPNDQLTKAGVDYKRYLSTGVFNPTSWANTVSRTALMGAYDREIEYEFYDPASPPDQATLGTRTYYRRRYTFNRSLTERVKAIDFLYDTLLPSFRGYLLWNAQGQVEIHSERPVDSVYIRVAASATDTQIDVEDVEPWAGNYTSLDPLRGQLLVGATDLAGSSTIQGSLANSEVRSVTATAFTSDGNLITLAASGSGPSLAASGGNFSGGNSSTRASAHVDVSGSGSIGDTATITIDGVDIVYDCFDDDTAETIARSLSCAVNADPVIRRYVRAWYTGSGAERVNLVSKQGKLTLDSALEEDHAIGEECLRIARSYAHKALTYAGTTRGNIIDGSFKWPLASRQSAINQIKAKYIESSKDFSEQPLVINDYDHQEYTNQKNPLDIDLSGVDSYHQAARICNNAIAKLRDGRFFTSWSSDGEALLHEEGDVVCISHPSGGLLGFRNMPMRLEEITIQPKSYQVALTGRLYQTSQYSDAVEPVTLSFGSALTNYAAGPPAPSSLTLTQSGIYGVNGTYDTVIRGTVVYGAFVYGQRAKVYVTPPGGTEAYSQTLGPGQTTFEIPTPVAGLYTIRIVTEDLQGRPGGEISEDITIGNLTQTIGPPASFTATVDGPVVTYVWTPPSSNPERVTGYTIFQTDGTTVVMPKANVLTWTEKFSTLGSPVTRKIQASDSMGNVSTLVSVTFTPVAIPDNQLEGVYIKADGTRVFTGDQSMGSHKLTNVTDPTNAQDAATKNYVDALSSGLTFKASCRVATTANITLSGAQTIDGVSVIAGDRVLVKNQTTGSQNGIYVCAAGAWSRSTDADTSAEVTAGMLTAINEGSVNADTLWLLTTNDPITLGTTSLTFAQYGVSAPTGGAVTINNQTGTTYTLQSTDNGALVVCDNASAITVTVPSGLGLGFNCMILQKNSGQVTLSASGTTLNNRQGQYKTAGQYAMISLAAYVANTFMVGGDSAA